MSRLLGTEPCGRRNFASVNCGGSRPVFQTSSRSEKSITCTLPLLV